MFKQKSHNTWHVGEKMNIKKQSSNQQGKKNVIGDKMLQPYLNSINPTKFQTKESKQEM